MDPFENGDKKNKSGSTGNLIEVDEDDEVVSSESYNGLSYDGDGSPGSSSASNDTFPPPRDYPLNGSSTSADSFFQPRDFSGSFSIPPRTTAEVFSARGASAIVPR